MRRKPRGVLWALRDGTRLMLAGAEGVAIEVTLSAGEVLIFDGDLVHAGAAYPHEQNTRVHMYLYARGGARPRGTSWMVPGFKPRHIVKWHSHSTTFTL